MGKTREWNEKYLERQIEIYIDIKRHREASTSIERHRERHRSSIRKNIGRTSEKHEKDRVNKGSVILVFICISM